MRLVYLGGPIDQMGREDRTTSRRRMDLLLNQNGFSVYDPSKAVVGGPAAGLSDSPDPRCAEIHRAALERCDAMVALLPHGVPTIGTPMELEQARVAGKVCVVLSDSNSWHLVGYPEIDVTDTEDKVIVTLLARFDAERDQQMRVSDCMSEIDEATRYAMPEESVPRTPKMLREEANRREVQDRQLVDKSFSQLQKEIDRWAVHNFGEDQPDWHPLLGVGEEAGELMHVYLKTTQGIRSQSLDEKGRDAVGDLTVYLMAFCEKMGWDFEETVRETWGLVKQRDWKRFPKDGVRE